MCRNLGDEYLEVLCAVHIICSSSMMGRGLYVEFIGKTRGRSTGEVKAVEVEV